MMAFENVMFSQPVAKGGDLNCFGVICLMYSNTVFLQCSNLKDYQWVRCTHNTLAQGSSKDCTTFGLERFRALSHINIIGLTKQFFLKENKTSE